MAGGSKRVIVNNLVTIDITEEEAVMFKEFMERYEVFDKLLRGGFFDIRKGSAEVHFNASGDIDKMVCKVVTIS